MSVIPKQIGWSEESNLLWNVLKELNKLGGAISNLSLQTKPKYKVFTALLTQSGTSSGPLNIFSGPVTQGVTYVLLGVSNASDFSNVGGPAAGFAVDGMYFIATATLEPNNYGGGGLIFDKGAPVATILENTIGNVWFTYDTTGTYTCQSNNLFISNKTFVNIPSVGSKNSDAEDLPVIVTNLVNNNRISFLTALLGTGTTFDGALYNSPIEIRIYN